MKVNIDNLKRSHQITLFAIDGVMLLLISLNLIWIIFDTLFASEFIRHGLTWLMPGFSQFYGEKIHPDFVTYDLIFVAIFLTEFVIRWIVAIIQKTHHRWFFFPFVHWYDLVGCIPVGSFRWLRLLRVISILYRLNKYGVIDLKNSAPGRFLIKYYNVLVEEISDRVVENVLSGVQDEVRQGSPVVDKILTEVLIPQKTMIANWLTVKINEICDDVYLPNQAALRAYIEDSFSDSLSQDPKVAALETVPVVGPKLVEVIDQTISDVVFNIVNGLLLDIGKQETDQLVTELLDGVIHKLLQPSDELNAASKKVMLEAIDIIKDQVRIQRWRQEAIS
ncbi:ion transporter [Ketobacter sp.]|uniref:ion transporter n=1 Tax=Ketobacter sp. TaxID=2083498 RepID=UPI000F23CF06|nr:ion transporter [Ketobacter sp.]RLT97398.1 MAG: ion transporter [Ketobacter sp.]